VRSSRPSPKSAALSTKLILGGSGLVASGEPCIAGARLRLRLQPRNSARGANISLVKKGGRRRQRPLRCTRRKHTQTGETQCKLPLIESQSIMRMSSKPGAGQSPFASEPKRARVPRWIFGESGLAARLLFSIKSESFLRDNAVLLKRKRRSNSPSIRKANAR
jgi:hypothetical protein